MVHTGQTLENPASGERITFRQTSATTGGELLAIDLELPANTAVGLADQGRTMLGGIRGFEDEVQGAFPPPRAWLARRREHARSAPRPLHSRAPQTSC